LLFTYCHMFTFYLPNSLDANGCLLGPEQTSNYIFRPNLPFHKIVTLLSILTDSHLAQ
jgi:hypothetical protein